MPKVAVIGTTSWGTTLAILLARKGTRVRLWARTREQADTLERDRENCALLPGVSFPSRLSTTSSLDQALEEATLAILAVPAQRMRQNVSLLKPCLGASSSDLIVVSAAKGIELGTGKRMSQVVADEIPRRLRSRICVLSGPNLSREIAQGLPAATVVAAVDMEVACGVQELLTARNFGVFTSTDVIGVELGGALKNIIALGAGIADGLNCGDNAKAALVTRGWAEITALGVALGADPRTFSGLAGLGDLFATCASNLSRNHYVGSELARGKTLKKILASTPNVAEGVDTTRVARELARKAGVEMPITELIYQVLFESLPAPEALSRLLATRPTHELEPFL